MKIISLVMGVQSTALYYQSSMGELPKADFAIFSDPGKEAHGTYTYLSFLQKWADKNNGIPIVVKNDKNLYKDILRQRNSTNERFASIPAFTKNPDGTTGMLRRQCTNEYKIEVIDKAIREIYGLKRFARTPETEVWKGITMDEKERVSIPGEKWKILIYPYVGYKVVKGGSVTKLDWGESQSRTDIVAWYMKNNLPLPPKSSCIFCPYHSDKNWAIMKKESPVDFLDAVRIDKAIRQIKGKKIDNPMYLHVSCKPLDKIIFNEQNELPFGECSGECDV